MELTVFENKIKDAVQARNKRNALYKKTRDKFYESIEYVYGVTKVAPELKKTLIAFEQSFQKEHPKVIMPIEYWYDLRQTGQFDKGWYRNPKLVYVKEKEYVNLYFWHAKDYESLGEVLTEVFTFITGDGKTDGLGNWKYTIENLEESVKDYKKDLEEKAPKVDFDDSALRKIDPALADKVKKELADKLEFHNKHNVHVEENMRLLEDYNKACQGSMIHKLGVLQDICLYEEDIKIHIEEYRN